MRISDWSSDVCSSDLAGVLFKGQVKKDFQQLIAFNRAITDERRGYLQEERVEIEAELKRVNAELGSLGKKRSDILSFLSETDRKSVEEGKSVSIRVDHGGRRSIKKKNRREQK